MSKSQTFNWQPRHSGKTDAMFRELQAWCTRMAFTRSTPRLIVDRDHPKGAIACDENAEDGPTVTMHPEMRVRLEEWADYVDRFRWS